MTGTISAVGVSSVLELAPGATGVYSITNAHEFIGTVQLQRSQNLATWEPVQSWTGTTGARLTVTEDVDEGVKGVDYLHTDVWVSMGEPKEVWDERIKLLLPYQVNAEAIKKTGNPDVKFMHCLPAHRNHELTDDVADGEHSVIFQQAHNRLHAQKAILAQLFGVV